MASGQHTVVKPQRILDAAYVALDNKVVVSGTVTKRSFDDFKGAENDTLTFRVPGTVPVRTYGWRNDRSQPIRTDEYVEQTVTLTVSPNNDYTAIKLTDECYEWDFGGAWGRIFNAQTDAIARYLERKTLDFVTTAPYEVVIAVDPSAANIQAQADLGRDLFFNAFSDARAALNKMRNPDDNLYAVVGSNIASHLRKNQKLALNQGTGNENAFQSNTIGNYAGFTAVESYHIDPDEAYLYAASGFILFTAAPQIPQGAKAGAIQNKDGFAMRWLQDYDSGYQIDRSTFNSWNGMNYVEDYLRQVNEDGRQELLGTEKFFVRGIKLVLGTTGAREPGDGNVVTPGGDPNSDLAKVWNNQPFTGTLPAGEAYPNVLLTADATYSTQLHVHGDGTSGPAVEP